MTVLILQEAEEEEGEILLDSASFSVQNTMNLADSLVMIVLTATDLEGALENVHLLTGP